MHLFAYLFEWTLSSLTLLELPNVEKALGAYVCTFFFTYPSIDGEDCTTSKLSRNESRSAVKQTRKKKREFHEVEKRKVPRKAKLSVSFISEVPKFVASASIEKDRSRQLSAQISIRI